MTANIILMKLHFRRTYYEIKKPFKTEWLSIFSEEYKLLKINNTI